MVFLEGSVDWFLDPPTHQPTHSQLSVTNLEHDIPFTLSVGYERREGGNSKTFQGVEAANAKVLFPIPKFGCHLPSLA